MIKLTSLLAGMLLVFSAAEAQTVVLEQDVNQDTVVSKKGPNRKHFMHVYYGLGWMAGTSDKDVSIKNFRSTDIHIGYRYKRKLANWYALGLEFGYNRQSFGIKQGDDKLNLDAPFMLDYDKEHLIFHNLQGGVYQRFNFGKTGNRIGTFVDMGVYGTWTFDSARKTKMDVDNNNGNGPEKVKVKEKDLNYIEDLNYGVMARVGKNRFAIYGSYRLTDLLKKDRFTGNPQLPALAVGLQIGLH